MPNPFAILAEFLARSSAEVGARSQEDVPPEIRSKLKGFAQGALSPADRTELIELLHQNPHWLAALADEARSVRDAP